MSFDALAWAAKQSPGSSGAKLVLLGLAECADRVHSLAFPSVAALVEFSCLDRKSVIANLAKLEASGFITDTGRKVGQTKQIKVYQLNLESVPKTEQSQKRNDTENDAKGPKNGTRNLSEPVTSEAKASSQRVFDHWNGVAKRHGFRPARILDASRAQTLRLRVKTYGEEGLMQAFDRMAESSWLRGEGRDSKWKPHLDFALRTDTIRKSLEGTYGEDDKPAAPRAYVPTTAEECERSAQFWESQGNMAKAAEMRSRAKSLGAPVGQLAQKILGGMAAHG